MRISMRFRTGSVSSTLSWVRVGSIVVVRLPFTSWGSFDRWRSCAVNAVKIEWGRHVDRTHQVIIESCHGRVHRIQFAHRTTSFNGSVRRELLHHLHGYGIVVVVVIMSWIGFMDCGSWFRALSHWVRAHRDGTCSWAWSWMHEVAMVAVSTWSQIRSHDQ